MARKPTIYDALESKLGRVPTNAELKAEVERIKREVVVELAGKGKLRHQRKNPTGAEQVYLWGYHRIRGEWERLQGPSDTVTMEQYKPYFEKTTLSQFYANTPHSGFSTDERPVYSSFVISGKKPKAKRNPRPAADEMYQSFHGEPSDETIEISGEENYHSHVAALGELVELKVKLVGGGTAVIGFEVSDGDVEENPKRPKLPIYSVSISQAKNIPSRGHGFVGLGNARKEASKEGSKFIAQVKDSHLKHVVYLIPSASFSVQDLDSLVRGPGGGFRAHENPERNPFWPFNSFTHTTIYHVGAGKKSGVSKVVEKPVAPPKTKVVSEFKGQKIEKQDQGYVAPGIDPNVFFDKVNDVKLFIAAMAGGGRLKNPLVRNYEEWVKTAKNPGTDFSLYNAAMKADDAFQSALEKEYGKRAGDMRYQSSKHPAHIKKLAKIKHEADEKWLNEMRKKNPRGDSSGPVYLTSNEDGTQLFVVGGDQSLDLSGLNITGQSANKELITIGSVTNICYHAHKIFDGKREEFDYVHKFSEDSHGPLPVLIYDRINRQLKLSGGVYKIERPLVGTSPGIED